MLPKLVAITPDGRRVYPCQLIINNRDLTEIHIDPHYELNHGNYMSDELIYELAQQLNYENFIVEDRKDNWEYFSMVLSWKEKNYKIIWCLEDKQNYLGIIHCYRKK